MNYKSFNIGDWIGHISGVIEDESELDGNEMRDLVEFLSILKQKSCTDAISRQAVLDTLDNHKYSKEFCEEHHIDWSINLDMARIAINNLPPTVSKEKTGKWINDWEMGMSECSCCGETYLWEDYKGTANFYFCPDCGAKMVEPQESEVSE